MSGVVKYRTGTGPQGHSDGIRCIVISKDGKRLYTGSYDTTVRIWDVESGRIEETLKGHKDWVVNIVLSRSQRRLYSACSKRTICVWELHKAAPEAPTQCSLTIRAAEGHLPCLALTTDETTLFCGGALDGTIKVYKLFDGTSEQLDSIVGHKDWVSALYVSPNGDLLISGSFDSTIKVWTCEEQPQIISTLTGHTDWVSSFVMPVSGPVLYSASQDQTIRLWHLKREECMNVLTLHNDYVSCITMSQDCTTLYSASGDGTVATWELPEGRVLTQLRGHKGAVTGVVCVAGGDDIFSCSMDRSLIKWPRAHLQSGPGVAPQIPDTIHTQINKGPAGPAEVLNGANPLIGKARTCLRCTELREGLISQKTLTHSLKNQVRELNLEIENLKLEGKQWATHFSHKSDNRDKAWQTIQQRLMDAEREKLELDMHRRNLTKDIDWKKEQLAAIEKKAVEDVAAAEQRAKDAERAQYDLERESNNLRRAMEKKEKKMRKEMEEATLLAQAAERETKELQTKNEMGFQNTVKNCEDLAAQLKKERTEGRTEITKRVTEMEAQLLAKAKESKDLAKKLSIAEALQFAAERRTDDVETAHEITKRECARVEYELRKDNAQLKQRVQHLMDAIQELEEPSSEEEDEEPAATTLVQSPVSSSPSPGPSSPCSPASPVPARGAGDTLEAADGSLTVDVTPVGGGGDGLEDKYSPQARAEAKKSKKKMKALQNKLAKANEELTAAHARLEIEREQHKVEMQKLRFEMENSRRVLSSYKAKLGDPKVDVVENVGSVGDPGRGITPGVAGVIAHRSILDKLADTLRPGISANRPSTAMLRPLKTSIEQHAKSIQARPRSGVPLKPGTARPGWAGATLSSRPTSAFVSKLREVGPRNNGPAHIN